MLYSETSHNEMRKFQSKFMTNYFFGAALIDNSDTLATKMSPNDRL